MTTTETTAAERMQRAGYRMLSDHGFFGQLLFQLKFVETTKVKTLQTNGTVLRYNPDFVMQHTDKELDFDLAHEIGHCVKEHMYRMDGRDPELWNEATDYQINGELVEDGFTAPKGVLLNPDYKGMFSEQIYALIWRKREEQKQKPQDKSDDDDEQPEDDDAGESEPDDTSEDDETEGSDEPDDDQSEDDADASDSDDSDDSDADEPADAEDDDDDTDASGESGNEPDETESPAGQESNHFVEADADDPEQRSETDWDVMVDQAAGMARAAGQLSDAVDRGIKHGREVQQDWREILRQYFAQTVVTDTSWTRPRKCFIYTGTYMPGLVRDNKPVIVCAQDTSGSMPQDLVEQGLAEVATLMHEFQPQAVHLLSADAGVTNARTFTPYEDEDIEAFEMKGGGGTTFQPTFDWVEENLEEPPALLVYFTDLYCSDQPVDPGYPVLFLVPEWSVAEAPFGEKITMPVGRLVES